MEKKILFYEWSDINRQPIEFDNVTDFYQFCENSNIHITGNNKYYIRQYSTIYAICAKGKSEIVLSGDYKNLRKNFSKHNKD